MHTIRVSSLPLLMACPGAGQAEIPSKRDGLAATNGTAIHECLATLVGGRDPDVETVCHRLGAELTEVRVLVAMGAQMWAEVAVDYPESLTELELSMPLGSEYVLTGHIDLLSAAAGRIGDWKSGRRDEDYRHQLYGYGALVLADNPALDSLIVETLWIRDREVERRTLTRDACRLWVADVQSRIVRWDGIYHPGSHCAYCPRSGECEAKALEESAALAPWVTMGDITQTGRAQLATMAPDTVIALLEQARQVTRMAYQVQDMIRDHVAAGGVLAGSSRTLELRTEDRRKLDPLTAFPVLSADGFSDADFAEVMSLSISAVEDLVAKRAGKGKGAKAVRELRERLTTAGAISIEQSQKLTIRRNP